MIEMIKNIIYTKNYNRLVLERVNTGSLVAKESKKVAVIT